MQIIKKLSQILNRRLKIKLLFLVVGIIVGAILETVALAVISPFISIMLDNSSIQNNDFLRVLCVVFGFNNSNSLLAFLAFSIASIYVFQGVYLFIIAKIKYRFLSNLQIKLSLKLLITILRRPYLYHVNKNIAEHQRVILTDAENLIKMITAVLSLAADLFMSVFILIFLLVQSVLMTLSVIGLALICVIFYFKVFRKRVKKAGEENRRKFIDMTKSVIQTLGGIKELKVLHREIYFTEKFKTFSNKYAKSNQNFQVYSSIPKLLIESTCFGGAFILIGCLIVYGVNIENLVPQLSLFVLASFRLLPAINRVISYINSIVFYKTSVDAVYINLYDNQNEFQNIISDALIEESEDIVISNITFQYPDTRTAILENVSLRIPCRKSVAFIGHTGAGKTTLADIILGIYSPQSGNMFYNGKSIHSDLEEWKKHIGYIPQQIYLLDESILRNVAFGVTDNEIDEKQVWKVLKKAQIREFVESLPNGVNTVVGDRGVRLSGGQRQRIGIARALYSDPDILVLDEATSSLDNETEKAVIEALESFKGDKTMIVIAHRLSTIENCDIVYRIDNKSVYCERWC